MVKLVSSGIRILETSNVTTIASTTTVYPSYILGMDCIWCDGLAIYETFYETRQVLVVLLILFINVLLLVEK